MALYLPPTKGQLCEQPYLALVSRADPDWQKYKYREVFYEFDGRRVFVENPYNQLYNDNSNVYPVGQAYGGLDPLRLAAKAPTVGNPVPGLYQGTATGSWG